MNRLPKPVSVASFSSLFLLLVGLGPLSLNPAQADDVNTMANPHAQKTNFYCGPGAIEMMLDSPEVRNNNPGLAASFAANVGNANDVAIQNQIYAKAHSSNFEPWFTDPQGMKTALNFFDGAAHNYNWLSFSFSDAGRKAATRTLANSLKDYNVPASILINGGAHWVTLDRVKTTGAIGNGNPHPAYQIDEFIGHDPAYVVAPKLSLGKNFSLSVNNRAFYKYFTPVNTNSSFIWGGKYVEVVEPIGPELPDDGSFDPTPLPLPPLVNPLGPSATISDLNNMAGLDLAADVDLNTEYGLENGSFDAAHGMFHSEPGDPVGEGDWIIPYQGPAAGTDDITGAVAIDALTGAIDYATWDDPTDPFFNLATLDEQVTNALDGNLLNDSGAQVPEPSTLCLLGIGCIGLFAIRRRASR